MSNDAFTNAAANRVLHELVSRYGEAASLDLSAYDGMSGLNGQSKRSLKSIAESRLGKTADEARRNLQQQAGFSAEVTETTKINKQRIINGEKVRNFRMDDLGKTNDQLVDTVDAVQMSDGTWKEVAGTGAQMKFIGKNGSETFDKLCSAKHEKYYASGTPVKIPKDYYPDFVKKVDTQINALKQEIKTLNAQKANPDLIASKKAQLKKYETIRKNTFSSETTSKEALFARTNPKLYTAQSMLSTAHDAGMEGAKSGALIGGGMAIVSNLDAILKGKSIDDAIKDVATKSAKSAARSYVVASGATLIEGGLQHYKSDLPKLLKNAKAPTEVAGFVVDAASAFYNYYNGSISGVDCMKQLASSASLALLNLTPVGQAVFIARTAYTLASISVSVIRDALKAPKIARELRIQIENECREQIQAMRAFREEFEQRTHTWIKETTETFKTALDTMDNALQLGDIDTYICGANKITHAMGCSTQFNNCKEFDSLMESDEAFVL
ncbi:hypothetical protein [Fibrobacter sp. UBA4297]|uniref:hypothetical protein n=1 Tax=Fibrobacter sp. UBA4297 TaxID=1946536 RepID=UPI0025B9DB6A|nr:hypothetical protein [Fibrobacter sp. UBA4297]